MKSPVYDAQRAVSDSDRPAWRIEAADRVESLHAQYTLGGRVQVRDVFDLATADAIHRCLAQQKQWNLVYTVNGRHVAANALAFAQWPAEKRRKLERAIYAEARYRFQYYYAAIPIDEIYQGKRLPGHFINAVFEFLNSRPFLDFVRAVTGDGNIDFADAQATRYSSGHFLTCHDDNVPGKGRRVAYVLSLTPLWIADWGGALQFFGATGNVEDAYTPCYNALNLFRVPTDHSVGIVAPFADAPRYSITGWLRSRTPDA